MYDRLVVVVLIVVSLGCTLSLHFAQDKRIGVVEQQNSELVTMLHEKLADKGETDLCK